MKTESCNRFWNVLTSIRSKHIYLLAKCGVNLHHSRDEQGFIQNHVESLLEESNESLGFSGSDLDILAPTLKVDVERRSLSGSSKESFNQKAKTQREHAESHGEDSDDDQDELDLIEDAQEKAESEDVQSEASHPSTGASKEEEEEAGQKESETMNIDQPTSLKQHTPPTPPSEPHPKSLGNTSLSQETQEDASNSASQDEQMEVDAHATASTETNAQSSQVSAQTQPNESPVKQVPPSPETILKRAQTERVPLKATPTDIGISPGLLTTPKASITIPAPIEPSLSTEQYSATVAAVLDQILPDSATPQQVVKAPYTHPPTDMLPLEFNRKKVKRKKDRSDRKGEDLPMGLNRWAATLNANPVYSRLKRATKCLSSKEWSVSIESVPHV